MATSNDSLPHSTAPAERLESVLLTALIEEANGRVTLPADPEWGPLYLRKGMTYLSKAKALEIVQSVSPAELENRKLLRGVEDPSKRRLLLAILTTRPGAATMARFEAGNPPAAAAPFIGPLPTRDLIEESALYGVSDAALLEGLGGPTAWLETRLNAPGLAWLSALGQSAQRWVSRFAEPETVEVALTSARERGPALREIARLHALGILWQVADPRKRGDSGERRVAEGSALVPPETLASFLERIRDSLADVPLGVDQDQHRREVAELIAQRGGSDHYELLGIPLSTQSEEIIGPYRQLARLVHPDHASRLQLAGGEAALAVLFERATKAYLVLSDPDRRRKYDVELDLSASQVEERSAEEISASRLKMAHRSYREARRQLQAEDFHYAYEHCQIAVHNDPQNPEYLALLGEIQSHNPKWLGEAANSLLKALEIRPKEPVFLYQLATVYERMGNDQAALGAYEGVLEKMSNHPGALEGVERLSSKASSAGGGGVVSTLKRWFSGE